MAFSSTDEISKSVPSMAGFADAFRSTLSEANKTNLPVTVRGSK